MKTLGFALFLFVGIFSGSAAIASLPAHFNTISGINYRTAQPASISFSQSPSVKGTVVVFLSAQCPCSRSHIKKLTRLASVYRTQGIEFVGVHSNQDEDFKEARPYFSRLPGFTAILRDPHATLAKHFKAFKTPHVFLFSRAGEVLYSGGVDDSKDSSKATKEYLGTVLAAFVRGADLPFRETRTLGCVIER